MFSESVIIGSKLNEPQRLELFLSLVSFQPYYQGQFHSLTPHLLLTAVVTRHKYLSREFSVVDLP